jgi:hypothetical protein
MSTALQAAASIPGLMGNETHAFGVDVYIYLNPLILMDLTRKQSVKIGGIL